MQPGTQRFLRVVHALIDGERPLASMMALNETAAYLRVSDNSVAIVIHPSKRGDELLAAIKDQLELDKKTHLKLVIVGGGTEMKAILERAQPRMLARRMVQVFAVPDHGEAWAGRASRLDSDFGKCLVAITETSPEVAPTFADLAARVPKVTEADRAEAREQVAFVNRYQSRSAPVTLGLLGFLLCIFGLEFAFGGVEYIPTLVRMGANTEASVGAEPWRLLSSVSLHAGLLHMGVNGVVLYILGGQLERILGWSRIAILLVVSGLFGSLASALAGAAALSVGASGAIWGVLGAAGAISLRPGDLLPASFAKRMRRAALINLGLNLAASFIPQVDFMAHLGGGLAGAALGFSGVLTRGLTPMADASAGEKPEARSIVWAGAAALVALGLSTAVAILVGRPWDLVSEPRMRDVALGVHDLIVFVPEQLGESDRVEVDGSVSFKFGDGLTDSLAVVVDIRPAELINPASVAERFVGTPVEPFEGATPIGERTIIEDAAFPTFEERSRFPNGLVLTTRFTRLPAARVIVESAVWDDASPAYKAAAEKSVASLRVARE